MVDIPPELRGWHARKNVTLHGTNRSLLRCGVQMNFCIRTVSIDVDFTTPPHRRLHHDSSRYTLCSATAQHMYSYHHGLTGSMSVLLCRKSQSDLQIISIVIQRRSDEHLKTPFGSLIPNVIRYFTFQQTSRREKQRITRDDLFSKTKRNKMR